MLNKEFPYYHVKKHYPDRIEKEKFVRRKFALSYASKLWQWRSEHPYQVVKLEVIEVRSEIDFEVIATYDLGQNKPGRKIHPGALE